ncbi:MAG: type II secretion system secretin GspD [Steroidobacteraceae bacterium]
MHRPNPPSPARRRLSRLAISLALGLALAGGAGMAHSQEQATITPNYKDADLSQIIQAVSEVTGKNFIIDPRVNAKVTMLSATPMSPQAFYEAFLSVLQVYGYVAVPAGKVIKIVPNTDARQLPANDLPNSLNSSSDEIVTQIITMKNVNAAQLVPLLRPLIPQYGHLAAYPGGNMLIISDRANNVNRIVRIIRRMDEAGDDPVDVVLLQNASANEIVRIVNQLYQAQGGEGGGGGAVKMVADERTNSVLISGEKAQRLRLKALIVNLDTPLESGGDTQVRYLRYADAEKIAEKLKGQATATAKAQAGATSNAAGAANLDSSATIWADPATNALIITAPPKIMRSLMAVIDKLDIRRAQVEVEAIIVEVDANKSSNLGVQWAVYGQGNTAVPGAVSNLPGSGASIVDLIGAAATGNAAGLTSKVLGTGATLAVGRYNKDSGTNFAAILQALRSDGSSNVISTPTLTTMDNQEAEVKVTTDVPLITGSYASTNSQSSSGVNPFQTIQRQELGTILKVTPQINLGDSVTMKIEQEDSAPGAKLQDSADISTIKRSIKTTVLIEDGGIVVLGGLISDTVSESQSRVPFLGRIPLLGELFKSRSGSRQKKNLMVFIRPKILRDGAETAIATGDKYNFMRNQQRDQGKGITLLPGERQPVLPVLPPTPPVSLPPAGPAKPGVTAPTPGPDTAPASGPSAAPASTTPEAAKPPATEPPSP